MKVFASLLLLASYASAIYLKVEALNTAHINYVVECDDEYKRDPCFNLCWRHPYSEDEKAGKGYYYLVNGKDIFITLKEYDSYKSGETYLSCGGY